MINQWTVIGRVGKEPDGRFIGSGSCVFNFPVATDRKWKDKQTGEWKKETDWVAVVAWNKQWIGDSLHKGDLVQVSGRGQLRSYDKDGQKHYVTELVAEQVINLSAAVNGKSGARTDQESHGGPSWD